MTTIAIDPGKNGGIAFALIHGQGCHKRETHSVKMPETNGDILSLLVKIKATNGSDIECWMEDCVKYAGKNQSGSSAITYGRNFGFLEGAIQALGIPLRLVRPQKWIKALSLGTKNGASNKDWKNKLKAEAQRLYPSQEVRLYNADALLILEYARKEGLTNA